MSEQKSRQDYWKANLIGGYQLGFWFAQQGSIYVFVVLIFFYAARMKKLDREYDVHED
jgi:putative solute:sodium symporter small subunit